MDEAPTSTDAIVPGSPRRNELLERAYELALRNGLSTLSLRPLATAIGSSPRVLLFLFGSKHGLVRALLARARADELAVLGRLGAETGTVGLAATATELWSWLATEDHRGLLRLWTESYARSLVEPDGPWAGFARETVEDWLELLAAAQPPGMRRTRDGERERTFVLAILRGAMLDLLATGDVARTTDAVRLALSGVSA